jgi:hypothetical protein
MNPKVFIFSTGPVPFVISDIDVAADIEYLTPQEIADTPNLIGLYRSFLLLKMQQTALQRSHHGLRAIIHVEPHQDDTHSAFHSDLGEIKF